MANRHRGREILWGEQVKLRSDLKQFLCGSQTNCVARRLDKNVTRIGFNKDNNVTQVLRVCPVPSCSVLCPLSVGAASHASLARQKASRQICNDFVVTAAAAAAMAVVVADSKHSRHSSFLLFYLIFFIFLLYFILASFTFWHQIDKCG